MKVLGFWFVVLGIYIVAAITVIVTIDNIDDLSSLIRDKSLWWHIPAFLICGYTVVTSGIVIFNRLFG